MLARRRATQLGLVCAAAIAALLVGCACARRGIGQSHEEPDTVLLQIDKNDAVQIGDTDIDIADLSRIIRIYLQRSSNVVVHVRVRGQEQLPTAKKAIQDCLDAGLADLRVHVHKPRRQETPLEVL